MLGKELWSAASLRGPEDIQWAEMDKAIAVSDTNGSPVYFVAPSKFTGDQRASYNQDLWFTSRVQKVQVHPSARYLLFLISKESEIFRSVYFFYRNLQFQEYLNLEFTSLVNFETFSSTNMFLCELKNALLLVIRRQIVLQIGFY